MQKNILQKALDELNKETPNIEKVKGMLETLVEMDSPSPVYTPLVPSFPPNPYTGMVGQTVYTTSNVGTTVELTDEEKLAQDYGSGLIGKI